MAKIKEFFFFYYIQRYLASDFTFTIFAYLFLINSNSANTEWSNV